MMPTMDGKDVKIVVNENCVGCGLCVQVCPCEYLEVAAGRSSEKKAPLLGCLTCGQCTAVCPTGAIHVEACQMDISDVISFSTAQESSYDALYRLMLGRRSIRQYTAEPISGQDVQKILEAAQQAPAGLPPSDVECVVISGKEKVRAFAFDFIDEVIKKEFLFSKAGVWALRPMMDANMHYEMREKIAPLYRGVIEGKKNGQDFLFYDAPLAMLFLSSNDQTNAVIASTYAMMAAQSLKLGSCMIGMVAPMLPMMGRGFKVKYQIPASAKHGLAVIFGKPAFQFQRGVRRRFQKIVL